MRTEIFESYKSFLQRKDKTVNGVSRDVAEFYYHWENDLCWASDNKTNEGCWNCLYCTDCLYCTGCHYCKDCYNCNSCNSCTYCICCHDAINCQDCTYCYNCKGCSYCSDCYDCHDRHNCIHLSVATGEYDEN